MKYLIVGGVAGGATAAARIRRNTEKDEIILFEKGDHISYANCGLPYYVGGVIADRDRLFVQTPEAFGRRFRIDVRVRQEVTRVDPATRTVTVRRADGSTYTETYDKLLLSPGSSPVRPPLPGVESEGIFTLRNVSDTDRIKRYLGHNITVQTKVVSIFFYGIPYLLFFSDIRLYNCKEKHSRSEVVKHRLVYPGFLNFYFLGIEKFPFRIADEEPFVGVVLYAYCENEVKTVVGNAVYLNVLEDDFHIAV